MTETYKTYEIEFPNGAYYYGYTQKLLTQRLDRHVSAQYYKEGRSVSAYLAAHGWNQDDVVIRLLGRFATKHEAEHSEAGRIHSDWYNPKMINRVIRLYRPKHMLSD